MARRNNYVETLLGACGHVVQVWPCVSGLGGVQKEYVCDECTREKWGIDADEALAVWVREAPIPKEKVEKKPSKKTSPVNLQGQGAFPF